MCESFRDTFIGLLFLALHFHSILRWYSVIRMPTCIYPTLFQVGFRCLCVMKFTINQKRGVLTARQIAPIRFMVELNDLDLSSRNLQRLVSVLLQRQPFPSASAGVTLQARVKIQISKVPLRPLRSLYAYDVYELRSEYHALNPLDGRKCRWCISYGFRLETGFGNGCRSVDLGDSNGAEDRPVSLKASVIVVGMGSWKLLAIKTLNRMVQSCFFGLRSCCELSL